MRDDIRLEMISLLRRILGDKPLPDDLQRAALGMLEDLMEPVSRPVRPSQAFSATSLGDASVSVAGVGNRRLVYVHGICLHKKHFSDGWWEALHPYVSTAFGEGELDDTRLEVVWSDIVNVASANLAIGMAAAQIGQAVGSRDANLVEQESVETIELSRRQASEEIKESLRDRADHHILNSAIGVHATTDAPIAMTNIGGSISIPGLNCIDDFSIYLTSNTVRQRIVDRFIAVVRPELQAGHELDIVSHSWGTVVAYEGLRQLERAGFTTAAIGNFFTVGAALSIGPVKMRLLPANKDGSKPAMVQRWVNVDAHGDLVGGPLQGRPYAVDLDFLNLDAIGCTNVFGFVNPGCAHSSYFDAGNIAVNRDIFAKYINMD
jgi:hypothetical protein